MYLLIIGLRNNLFAFENVNETVEMNQLCQAMKFKPIKYVSMSFKISNAIVMDAMHKYQIFLFFLELFLLLLVSSFE